MIPMRTPRPPSAGALAPLARDEKLARELHATLHFGIGDDKLADGVVHALVAGERVVEADPPAGHEQGEDVADVAAHALVAVVAVDERHAQLQPAALREQVGSAAQRLD